MAAIDTGTEALLVDITDGVATVTMNRPEARNAMNREMMHAMGRVFAELEHNPDARCIVLTGAGKGFCSGGDIKGMADEASGGATSMDESIHRQREEQRGSAGRLYKMPKPTLAALPGAAAGAGFSLALACDMRIMASNAIMTTAFAKVGFAGDYGGTFFLTHLVGSAKARELYMLSDRVSADEALALGLTNWVCEPEELQAKTKEMALRLANGPSVAYRYMKENLNRAVSGEIDDCLDLEATHHIHSGQTEDHKTAVQAFLNKTDPVFQGR
jgi:2-(1,2-epoxy-1,2-dihydrophenyl)acetyl-CoA isomerase